MPDIIIHFLDIRIGTTTTTERKKVSKEEGGKKNTETISHRRGGYQVVRNFIKVQNTVRVKKRNTVAQCDRSFDWSSHSNATD